MSEFTDRQRAVFDSLGAPAEQLFALYGIATKKNGEYLNLSRCPWCNHGAQGRPNYQCGVRETPRPGKSGYLHSFKCQHSHDAPASTDKPHYADVLAQLGHISIEEALWAKSWRSDLDRQRQQTQVKNSATELRVINELALARLQRRLKGNREAMQWLTKIRGYSAAVIEKFKLGLSEEYVSRRTNKPETADALVAPLMGRDGIFRSKYVYYEIPGITLNNREPRSKAWTPGPTRAYYSGKADGHTRIFVCDGLKDLWATWDKIKDMPLAKDLLLVTTTNGGLGFPEEWKQPGYWEPWARVYLGHDNDEPNPKTGRKAGDEHATSIARITQRETRRVWPIGVKDWNDWWLAGHTVEEFERLLSDAHAFTLNELETAKNKLGFGRFESNEVDIRGAYLNGFLFDVVQVIEREKNEETGLIEERKRTLIVRSDGTLHRTRASPTPKGTGPDDVVYRLYPDGAQISGEPRASEYGTWRWPSIEAFVEKKVRPKPLRDLLEKVRRHLKTSVWLPYEDDYTLLACTVAVTYVQRVFDAVPLLLATGGAGTGKTQLGIAMIEVAANAPRRPIGQISAASIARLIDQSRGFVVLDDLESVGDKRGSDPQYSELVQALKLSYNKQSALKFWTNMKTGKLEKLDFFGVKLINNTRGVDSILGSRMFTIHTRKMPEGMLLRIDGRLTTEDQLELKDDLHTWAMMSAAQVNQAYSIVFPNKTTRADEISAPLKVIAMLAGDEGFDKSLEQALERQARQDLVPETSEQILREAIEDIVIETYIARSVVRRVVTSEEVIMRMGLLVDRSKFGKYFITELSDIESPEWVGRQLKQSYVKIGTQSSRLQMHGKFLRAYELSDEFLQKVIKTKLGSEQLSLSALDAESNPRAFCQACPECPYRSRCELQIVRFKREADAERISSTH